jgi:predicted O-methyltransferase YrrM
MLDPLWVDVDRTLCERLIVEDEALGEAVRSMTAGGLPAIQVSPNQGKWLHLMAKAIGARRILELGTLAGYSAIWLARALPPDGRLITLEVDSDRAALARTNVDRAGVGERVEIRVGKALHSLDALVAPFDFVFIDADKAHVAEYVSRCAALSRPGAMLIVDNVVRNGKIVDAESDDVSVVGVRRMLETVAADLSLEATALQTVGSKGHDGFLMAIVGDRPQRSPASS